MRDKGRQSTTFRHVQQRQVNYVAKKYKSESRCLLELKQYVQILPMFEKTSVNNNVLSKLKLEIVSDKSGHQESN